MCITGMEVRGGDRRGERLKRKEGTGKQRKWLEGGGVVIVSRLFITSFFFFFLTTVQFVL